MSAPGTGERDRASASLGLVVPILLIGTLLTLIAPISPLLLDLLLSANIAVSVVMLLQTIQVRRPRDFSVFPSLLLGTTLVRLVLNVASTRLILTNAGAAGENAAGGVILAFGDFVAAGSPLVGGIIFAILVVIQFLVITKGATRISEVAARFALDGLPGRQSAIDADLASGLIDAEAAARRRQDVAEQADFYGAMDGASKFIRGDAVAGLVITAVNILGGFAIGVLQEGMSLAEALSVFTILTIGDGLVSQVPALLISIAAGIIVTRASGERDLAGDVVGQLLAHPMPPLVAAGLLTALAFTGFPMLPMLGLAMGCCAVGLWLVSRNAAAQLTATTAPSDTEPTPTEPAPIERHLAVEPIQLELGVSLVRLADAAQGGDLLARVTTLRERVAADLGFILPKVRIQDELRLEPRQYRIKFRGIPVATGSIRMASRLAVDDGNTSGPVAGIDDVEPLTGRRAVWIDESDSETARELGYRLVTAPAVILQVLERVVRRQAGELLTREQVHGLLDHLRGRSPRLVDDALSPRLGSHVVHRVLGNLLAEGVPVRDLEFILETLCDAAHRGIDVTTLTAEARRALRRTITQRLVGRDGVLHVAHLHIAEDESFTRDLRLATTFRPDRDRLARLLPWFAKLSMALDESAANGHPGVILCADEFRVPLAQLLQQTGTEGSVLCPAEIPPQLDLRVVADVEVCSPIERVPVRSEHEYGQAAHLRDAPALVTS
jgi:flagellar biosynthesis protein FlhA